MKKTINYFSNGSKYYPKERIEVFCDGKIARLDNFRKLKTWGLNNSDIATPFSQNKGQDICIKRFIDAIEQGGSSPIAFNEIIEVQESILNLIVI